MVYTDGLVIAVASSNKEEFIRHANGGDSVFVEHAATRIVECWGDDVPAGKQTDFRRELPASDDETVVFSWIEWPDRATRNAVMEKATADPGLSPEANPMPFNGKRMICGGFAPIDLGRDA